MADTDNDSDITIIGFGTLLSEGSARRTCPRLTGFRFGRLPGHRRVFDKVDSHAAHETRPERACWSVERHDDFDLLVSIFEVPADEYPALVAREYDYDLKPAPYVMADGSQGEGIACYGFAREADFIASLEGDPPWSWNSIRRERHREIAGIQHGPTWRNDILPNPAYLARVLANARALGPEWVSNILDASFLGDRKTTIRQWLASRPDVLDVSLPER